MKYIKYNGYNDSLRPQVIEILVGKTVYGISFGHLSNQILLKSQDKLGQGIDSISSAT